jgi:7-keto-8-aminopelargonate synthetase-like enzyme
MSPANTAAALAALEVMRKEPERIERVNQIAKMMRTEFRKMGFDVGKTVTPIIPVIIGEDMPTIIAWKALYEAGIYTNPVIPPAVPSGSSLLRTSYMATHTDEQLKQVLTGFKEVGQRLDII